MKVYSDGRDHIILLSLFSCTHPTYFLPPPPSSQQCLTKNGRWEALEASGWGEAFLASREPCGSLKLHSSFYLSLHIPKTKGLDKEVSEGPPVKMVPMLPPTASRRPWQDLEHGILRGSLRARSRKKTAFLFLAIPWEVFLVEREIK